MTGYQSKRAAAQAIDKVNWADHEPNGLAQPAQEPVAWRDAAIRLGEELSSVGPDGYYNMSARQWLDWSMEQKPRGKNSLPPQRPEERNFCPRCGKRTADLTTIHTCTPPPQENA